MTRINSALVKPRSNRSARGSSASQTGSAGSGSGVRQFARTQASHEYRAARRAVSDKAEVSQRMVLNASTFAQMPLLNPDQVVTTWRELLPNNRDAEVRRVPVDLKQPGIYVVEAVNELLRAYTIVIVSDVGLVTKTSPGQMLFFAADRFTGEPATDCSIRVLYAKKAVAEGRTNADGLFEARLPDERMENIIGVAQCGDQHAATDPGSWTLQQPARELAAYIYTDKSIYRPGHTVHVKAILRWRQMDALVRFDRPEAEIAISDTNDKVVFRKQVKLDVFGAIEASFPVPATAALGNYAIRIQSGDAQGSGGFEVQEYRKPEFEVTVTPQSRFVVQGREAVVSVQARYYFGQPVANAQLRWVVNQQPYYSPLRWDDDLDGGGSSYWYGDNQTAEGTVRLDADGKAQIRVPLAVDDNGRDFSARIEAQVTDAANREVSGRTIVHATFGAFLLSAETGNVIHRAGGAAQISVRALDYLGTPQPNVPVTLVLEHLQYRAGYYGDARDHVDRHAECDYRRQRPRRLVVHPAESDRQLPRARDRTKRRSHGQRPGVSVGAGAWREHRRHQRPLSRAAVRQEELPAGRIRDADCPRRNGDRSGAGVEGRPARVVVPADAADAHGYH